MQGNFQFQQSQGDGSKSTYTYEFGNFEFDIEHKKGKFSLKLSGTWTKYVYFTISTMKMREMHIQVTGINESEYGKVSFLFSQIDFEHEVKVSNLKRRLQAIYDQTPGYYLREYGSIQHLDQIAHFLVKEGKEK